MALALLQDLVLALALGQVYDSVLGLESEPVLDSAWSLASDVALGPKYLVSGLVLGSVLGWELAQASGLVLDSELS